MFNSLNEDNLKALKLQLLNIVGIQEEDLNTENLNKLLDIIPIEYYKYVIRLLKIDELLEDSTVKLIYNKIHNIVFDKDGEAEEGNDPKHSIDIVMAVKTLLQNIGKGKDLNKALNGYSSYIKENKDEERLSPLFNTVAGILILGKSLIFDK